MDRVILNGTHRRLVKGFLSTMTEYKFELGAWTVADRHSTCPVGVALYTELGLVTIDPVIFSLVP